MKLCTTTTAFALLVALGINYVDAHAQALRGGIKGLQDEDEDQRNLILKVTERALEVSVCNM